jgi:hypothetical protein
MLNINQADKPFMVIQKIMLSLCREEIFLELCFKNSEEGMV